jgi:hypothetical protein
MRADTGLTALLRMVAMLAAGCGPIIITPSDPTAEGSAGPSATPGQARAAFASPATGASAFTPLDYSFVDPSHEWALLVVSNSQGGIDLQASSSADGGASWTTGPALATMAVGTELPVRRLLFADEYHGWAYGPALFATRDGGLSWSPVAIQGQLFGGLFAQPVDRGHSIRILDARLQAASLERGKW